MHGFHDEMFIDLKLPIEKLGSEFIVQNISRF